MSRFSLGSHSLRYKLIVGVLMMAVIPCLVTVYLASTFINNSQRGGITNWDTYLIVLSTFVSVIMGFVVTKDLINPVRRLIQWTKLVQEGNLKHRIEHQRKDEIGELFDFFNLLTRKLRQNMLEIERLSITDEMTGAYNYRYFRRFITEKTGNNYSQGQSLSLLMLDIDFFKRYNDHYGHPVGDAALRELTHILHNNVRKTDLVVRYGGEEFLIILPSTGKKEASQMAERIRQRVECCFFPEQGGRLTVSIGVASGFSRDKVDELVEKADEALYCAKRSGKNRVCIYREGLVRVAQTL